MEVKALNPALLLRGLAVAPIIEVYFEACHLKQLFRQGWLQRGIPRQRCESVAEHSFGVAMLAMFVADEHFPELDAVKIMRLALLHDFGEIYAGDLTPADDISQEEKRLRQKASMEQVIGKLARKKLYLGLWTELMEGTSPEARLVRQLDKLEMALQACVYEHSGQGGLGEFYLSAEEALDHPVLQQLLREILSLTDRST